jgi:hypothetical protein
LDVLVILDRQSNKKLGAAAPAANGEICAERAKSHRLRRHKFHAARADSGSVSAAKQGVFALLSMVFREYFICGRAGVPAWVHLRSIRMKL